MTFSTSYITMKMDVKSDCGDNRHPGLSFHNTKCIKVPRTVVLRLHVYLINDLWLFETLHYTSILFNINISIPAVSESSSIKHFCTETLFVLAFEQAKHKKSFLKFEPLIECVH